MSARGGWIVLALAALLVTSVGLDRRELDGTTAFYASIARQITTSGEWFPLQHGDAVYTLKPPLVFWAVAGSFGVFGVGDASATLAPRLFGVLCVLLTAVLASMRAGPRAGPWAGLVLLVSVPFLENAVTLRTDTALIAGLLLAWIGLLARDGLWRPFAFFGGMAVATLAKGLPGLLPLALGLVVWWPRRRVEAPWCAGATLLLPVVAYFVALQSITGTALAEVGADLVAGHERGWTAWTTSAIEHVLIDPVVASPHVAVASVFALRFVIGRARRREGTPAERRMDLVLALAWIAVIVAAAVKPSHRARYLLPALPVLAVWIATWIVHVRPAWNPRPVLVVLSVLAAASWFVPSSVWPENHRTGDERTRMREILAADLPPGAPVVLIESDPRVHFGRQWAGRDWVDLHLRRPIRRVAPDALDEVAGAWAVVHSSSAAAVDPGLLEGAVARTPNASLVRIPADVSGRGTSAADR